MSIDTEALDTETLGENPFAEALAPAAEPLGFTPWSEAPSPFMEVPEVGETLDETVAFAVEIDG